MGKVEGLCDGDIGLKLEEVEGLQEGCALGIQLGTTDGLPLNDTGLLLGDTDGTNDGITDGITDGTADGD